MYTGLIREVGEIIHFDPMQGIEVRAPKTCGELTVGGSVCVAGVCVTAESVAADRFHASLCAETQRRSTLDALQPGSAVNLELPLRAGDTLEGHLVQGHVDAIGKVTRVDDDAPGRRIWIRPPQRNAKSDGAISMGDWVAKGSVTVDGVSLTIAEVVRDRFSVALIPSTLAFTTLRDLCEGDRVNLETDLVGKLAARHGAGTAAALARSVAHLPWAGVVTGSLGVEKVVRQFASGGGVIVWDPDREQEGDVIFAGAGLRPEAFTFLLTQACCHPTVPCDRARLDRLEIPPMPGPGDHQGTAMHTSVDLSACSGTGVSPAERAATVRRLAAPDARPEDFVAPGHVFPLAGRPGGLRERQGHTEVTIALCEAAGLPTVGVCCEVMGRGGEMARAAELERLALEWGLPMIDIRLLVERL